MTSKNCTSGVEIGPRRYTVGKTGSWTLTVFQDGVMECNCPDATIRRRECYHQRDYREGKVTSKPRIRATVGKPLPKVVRARTSPEGLEAVTLLDV